MRFFCFVFSVLLLLMLQLHRLLLQFGLYNPGQLPPSYQSLFMFLSNAILGFSPAAVSWFGTVGADNVGGTFSSHFILLGRFLKAHS